MALHSLYCADVPLRNCSLTRSRHLGLAAVSRGAYGTSVPRPPPREIPGLLYACGQKDEQRESKVERLRFLRS